MEVRDQGDLVIAEEVQCSAGQLGGEARARRQHDAGLSLLEWRGLDDNTTQA